MPQHKVQDVFQTLLHGDQPAGWSIAGTKENIRKINRDDFIKYREKNYVASSTIVFVTGNIDEARITKDIENLFKNISTLEKQSKLKVIENQKIPAFAYENKKTDQTHLVLGVRSFPAKDKREPTLLVMNSVLSGGMSARLFQRLRDEMGVAYYVRSYSDMSTDHGTLLITAGVATNRLKESVSALMGELRRLRDDLIPNDELRKAKDYLTGTMYLGLESSDDVAMFIADQEILRKEIFTPDEVSTKLEKVTAEDIQTLAREIIKNENLNLAVISGEDHEDELHSILSV